MAAKFGIPGAMCLALAAAKPCNIDDISSITTTATTTTDMPMPTSGPIVAFELDQAIHVPVATATGVEFGMEGLSPAATAHGGALLDSPAPPAPTLPVAFGNMAGMVHADKARIKVINRHTAALTTNVASGFGPVATGNVGRGILERGYYGSFTVSPGWSGRVELTVAGSGGEGRGADSLIEVSFMPQMGVVKGDVDVSYVDAFTVPVLCWCDENKKSAGCDKDLFSIRPCPDPNGHGACLNPSRGRNVSRPTEFFKPCHFKGGAYTFDFDYEANVLNGVCPREEYTCCVGKDCRT